MYPFVINYKNVARNAIYQLLESLSISCGSHLDAIISATQSRWIRKNERWRVEEIYHNLRKPILACMQEIGCMKALYPKQNSYENILLLGAPLSKFLERLDFLNYLLNNGIKTKNIYLLSGHRPLDKEKEVILCKKIFSPKEYDHWGKRSLEGKEYVYIWADGIYCNVRLSDERPCLLVLIGATSEGRKELLAVHDGIRENKLSWKTVLSDLKKRDLLKAPQLGIGDGALGF